MVSRTHLYLAAFVALAAAVGVWYMTTRAAAPGAAKGAPERFVADPDPEPDPAMAMAMATSSDPEAPRCTGAPSDDTPASHCYDARLAVLAAFNRLGRKPSAQELDKYSRMGSDRAIQRAIARDFGKQQQQQQQQQQGCKDPAAYVRRVFRDALDREPTQRELDHYSDQGTCEDMRDAILRDFHVQHKPKCDSDSDSGSDSDSDGDGDGDGDGDEACTSKPKRAKQVLQDLHLLPKRKEGRSCDGDSDRDSDNSSDDGRPKPARPAKHRQQQQPPRPYTVESALSPCMATPDLGWPADACGSDSDSDGNKLERKQRKRDKRDRCPSDERQPGTVCLDRRDILRRLQSISDEVQQFRAYITMLSGGACAPSAA